MTPRRAARFALIALPLLVTAPSPAVAQDTPQPTTTPELRQRLQTLEDRLSELNQLRATFTQSRLTPLLRRPLESSGTLLLKDGKICWDTLEPRRSTMLASDAGLKIYYPDAETLEVYDAGADQAPPDTLGASPRLTELLDNFAITEEPLLSFGLFEPPDPALLGLRLTPIDPDNPAGFSRVLAIVNTEIPMITRVIMESDEGETTDLKITDIQAGAEVTDEEMALTVPPGTRISRPIGSDTEPDREPADQAQQPAEQP